MDLEHAPPPSLAGLIEPDVEPRQVWHAHELGEVLAHELTTPLRLELGEPPPGAAADGSGGLLSIGELLHHPDPAPDLLVRLKRFAKDAGADPRSHLPEDVAAVLYALAIAAALLRHGRRITSMSDRALGDYLTWAVQRPWLDAACHRLLLDASRAIGPGGAPARAAPPA